MRALGVMTGMKLAVIVLVVGCAVPKRSVPASHPASPEAPTGRLAGAPPSLRPGVVDYKEVPPLREGDEPQGGGHHHHH